MRECPLLDSGCSAEVEHYRMALEVINASSNDKPQSKTQYHKDWRSVDAQCHEYDNAFVRRVRDGWWTFTDMTHHYGLKKHPKNKQVPGTKASIEYCKRKIFGVDAQLRKHAHEATLNNDLESHKKPCC